MAARERNGDPNLTQFSCSNERASAVCSVVPVSPFCDHLERKGGDTSKRETSRASDSGPSSAARRRFTLSLLPFTDHVSTPLASTSKVVSIKQPPHYVLRPALSRPSSSEPRARRELLLSNRLAPPLLPDRLALGQIRKIGDSITIFSVSFARGGTIPFGGRSVRHRPLLSRDQAVDLAVDRHSARRQVHLARPLSPPLPRYVRDYPGHRRTRQAPRGA